MERIQIEEKRLEAALFQFIFPFSLNTECQKDLRKTLLDDGFIFFSLPQREHETGFYGEGYQVSHPRLERCFLPFAKAMIFPQQPSPHSFLRFSKRMNLDARMSSEHSDWSFRIHAADVLHCPFDIGFITLRVELEMPQTLSSALEFASLFRRLQSLEEETKPIRLTIDGFECREVEIFIFQALLPALRGFIDESDLEESVFEELPYFVDERMYVQMLLAGAEGETFTDADLYRAVRVDGFNEQGEPRISAVNKDYVDRFCRSHAYDRWSPTTSYIIDETCFACLTSENGPRLKQLASHLYGEYYYGLLINLFHKIVLLKLSNRYSHVQLERDPEKIEALIRDITTFSAKNYFMEATSQSQGKEMYTRLRDALSIHTLYEDVKRTLTDLFKYQENFSSRRSEYLLLILTIYTVISGIFGMNLVTDDLEGPVNFNHFKEYSVFQHFALVIMASGILIALGLGIHALIRLMAEWRKSRQD
ncbi:hypothetical protein SAMN02799630_05092 [Paenibacillus sp. UNCCL117]|uniref:hypothetical protein n=1 Tax=unclassified Paenibacillus TaxID=185978 RepID=UPI00089011FB|nr:MULTISPECIES: hypothetical protein [unclassified Paenibacillus]SDE30222.1 hypothetical protein SAMN04488602_12466 [Paenibacillus sp. cl123]SFW63118.1 hypothetical protein SAMN02799630_05092 [Paenibacillus sp. UNCCL117]